MNSSDIRSLIREVLAEELQGMRGGEAGAHADTAPKPQVREERVAIASDADLNRFVLRVLELAQDGRSVQEIKAGRWAFRLQGGGGSRPGPAAEHTIGSAPAETVEFDRGLVSERQLAGLSKNARIRAGKRVRFTPLAQDEIRRKGIHVERKTS
jgi:hypothetical protein